MKRAETTGWCSLTRFRTHEGVITEETKQASAEAPMDFTANGEAPAEARSTGVEWRLILVAAAYLALDYFARTLPASHGVAYPFGAMLGSGFSVLPFLYVLNDPAGIRPYTGLSWKQRPGSFPLSLAALGFILALHLIYDEANPRSSPGFWSILQLVIIAPVTEELAYRGVAFALLFQVFGTRSSVWPVLVTSVCFALPHAFMHHAGMVAFAGERFGQILLMGLILGAVRARSGSLLFPVLCHVLWNSAYLLILFICSAV